MTTLKNNKNKLRTIKSIKYTPQKIKLSKLRISKLNQKKLRRRSKKQQGGVFIFNNIPLYIVPKNSVYLGKFTIKGPKETTSIYSLFPTVINRGRHFFYYFDKKNTSHPHSIIYTESIPQNMKLGFSLGYERDDLNIKGWINFPEIYFEFNSEEQTGNFFYKSEKKVLTLNISKQEYDNLNSLFNDLNYRADLDLYEEQLKNLQGTISIKEYINVTMNHFDRRYRPLTIVQFTYYLKSLQKMIFEKKISCNFNPPATQTPKKLIISNGEDSIDLKIIYSERNKNVTISIFNETNEFDYESGKSVPFVRLGSQLDDTEKKQILNILDLRNDITIRLDDTEKKQILNILDLRNDITIREV